MKIPRFTNLIFVVLLIVLTAGGIFAQELRRNQKKPKNNLRQPRLLQTLGLSKQQIQQIRQLRSERQIQLRAAQMRLRAANRTLDEAIYSDDASEEEILQRVKEVETAQSDVIRIRFLTEWQVRKMLNAEQIGRFRQMRQEFNEQSEDDDELTPTSESEKPMRLNKRRFRKRN